MNHCSIDGCERPYKAKGFCKVHYDIQRFSTYPKCNIEGCNNKIIRLVSGICEKHARISKIELNPKCIVEGCENNRGVSNSKYCDKHNRHMYKFGEIIERTRFDKNEYVFFDDYAEMKIYNKAGNVCATTIIDICDVDKCKKNKWHLLINGYVSTIIKRKNIRLARFLLDVTDSNMCVDHIDGDRLHNTRDNLRVCTILQNNKNQKLRVDNTSGHKGVYLDKKSNTWFTHITSDKVKYHLGYGLTKEEAIKRREEAEIVYFGEYSRKITERK